MKLDKSERTFNDVETNEKFSLYINPENHNFHLISEGSEKHAKGTEVNGFYICAHSPIAIKINGSKVIDLPTGTFYNLKENETITHKKYCGFKRFTKVKD